MTKQNNGLLSPDKSNHSTGALAATLFPARRRNGTAVHQPKDVTEMEAAPYATLSGNGPQKNSCTPRHARLTI